MLKLLEGLYRGMDLKQDETIFILENLNSQYREHLYDYARRTCQRFYARGVFMRGLVEFSNFCKKNCLYCGLRASNTKLERYRLSEEMIIRCCIKGYELGMRSFVLQSGEDSWYTLERLISIIRQIKKRFPDAALTLSIGERGPLEYEEMFKAGADRYLLRHETASEALYAQLHPGMNWGDRVNCLETLKKIGYQVGAGFMVGLPGQGPKELAEDLHFLKKLSPHMIGIGPFIPHSETPLSGELGGRLEDTLDMIALTRLFVPDSLMPATTAIGSLHPLGREMALQAGANVVMPNLTPVNQKAKYALYENKICLEDAAEHCRYCIEKRIKSVGYEVDMGVGDCVRKAMPSSSSQ